MKKNWIISDEKGNNVISNSRKNVIELLFEEAADGHKEINLCWWKIDWIERECIESDNFFEWINTISNRITDAELNFLGFTITEE